MIFLSNSCFKHLVSHIILNNLHVFFVNLCLILTNHFKRTLNVYINKYVMPLHYPYTWLHVVTFLDLTYTNQRGLFTFNVWKVVQTFVNLFNIYIELFNCSLIIIIHWYLNDGPNFRNDTHKYFSLSLIFKVVY